MIFTLLLTRAKIGWAPKRVKTNADRQLQLLLAAFGCVKPGGRVVYATCALSSRENDEVVTKALNKTSVAMSVKQDFDENILKLTGIPYTKTKYGYHVLPDQGGWGPLYFSILTRQAPTFVSYYDSDSSSEESEAGSENEAGEVEVEGSENKESVGFYQHQSNTQANRAYGIRSSKRS